MKKKTKTSTSGIPVKNKLPKVHVKKLSLLKGITGIIANMGAAIATGGVVGTAGIMKEGAELAEAIELKTEKDTKVWRLIVRSLTDALIRLITESNGQWKKEDIETYDLDKRFEACLEAGEYYIDAGFFSNPSGIALVNDLKPIIEEYLGYFGFTDIQRQNILNRLNSYFIRALKNEWASAYEYYEEVLEVLNNPFGKMEERELNWDMYLNELEHERYKPVFTETFALEQVFIPLRACYKEKKKEGKTSSERTDRNREEEPPKEVVVDLQSYLLGWLEKGDKNDPIRIIRGGPGYGKSSCLKMLAARLAANRQKVLFIPLHRFDVAGKLDEAVRSFLRYDKFFTHDIINEETEKLILLFDGLDELSMQGRLLAEVAQSFLREVEKCVTNFNTRSLRLQVIISGRDVIVQQNERDFRDEGQILRLLPYYVPEIQQQKFIDKENLLETDQRDMWWKKYGKVTGQNYPGLPDELHTEEIDEITAQPLLNFLVALSFQRGKIEFTSQTNLNEVYADLLDAVYERGYSEGKKHQVVSGMEARHFCVILEEIALCAWHGKGRTTTVREINAHFEEGGLMGLMKEFISDAEQGVISLLVAFYFRQAGQTAEGAQTFEFTHKSFGEYLTARKMVRQLEDIDEQLKKNKDDFLKRNGWDIRKCLIEWIKVFGKKSPDADLVRFLRNELAIRNKQDKEPLLSWQHTIVDLLNYVLLKGMPMEHFREMTYYDANIEAINGERALLIFHSLLAWNTAKTSDIHWDNGRSFTAFIARLTGVDWNSKRLILDFCNHINLKNSQLSAGDFSNANFSCSNFQNANWKGSYLLSTRFYEADLQGCNLESSRLWNANMQQANMRYANFSMADLRGANLRGADLRESGFVNANLWYANLDHACLYEADLRNADLRSANFYRCNLQKVNLENARMEGGVLQNIDLQDACLYRTRLQNADLQNANLCNAYLQRVYLRNADLRNADLRNADLRNAHLEKADLRGANLSRANLENAKLEGANLEGANLEGANMKGTILDPLKE